MLKIAKLHISRTKRILKVGEFLCRSFAINCIFAMFGNIYFYSAT